MTGCSLPSGAIKSIGTNTAFGDNRIKGIENGAPTAPTDAARLAGNAYNIGEGLYNLNTTVNQIDGSVKKGNFASAVDAFKRTSVGSSKVVEDTSKILKVAGEYGNVLAVGSGVLNVIDADKDKKTEAVINNASALGGMIAAENAMKTEVVQKNEAKVVETLTSRLPSTGKWAALKPVLSAAAFVAASVGGYAGGKKVGETISGVSDTNTRDNKTETSTDTKTTQTVAADTTPTQTTTTATTENQTQESSSSLVLNA